MEIANAVEPVQDGRLHIEFLRSLGPPLSVSPKASQHFDCPHCSVYFAMPDPFELLPCWCNGLAGTLPCEARACSLSLFARVFRSLFRPLSNRSENSRGSIEESKLVSGEGFDHRLQARRIGRHSVIARRRGAKMHAEHNLISG